MHAIEYKILLAFEVKSRKALHFGAKDDFHNEKR